MNFFLGAQISCTTVTQNDTGVCLLVGCLTSQQHASLSHGRICVDNFTCCHTETEVADPTFYLTQSQYTDTGPISPSADLITPGAWQGNLWSASFQVTGMTRPGKKPRRWRDSNPGPSPLETDALTTRPSRRLDTGDTRSADGRPAKDSFDSKCMFSLWAVFYL